MPGDPLYDTDFYAWTQQQARLLKQVRDNRLDADNLAEEVADLGKSELRAFEGHLLQGLIHLVKLAAGTRDHPRGQWLTEVEMQIDQAHKAFSPSMRQHVDLGVLWQKAVKYANQLLSDYAEPGVPRDLPCPFTLDDLLASDFEPADACARIEQTIAAHAG